MLPARRLGDVVPGPPGLGQWGGSGLLCFRAPPSPPALFLPPLLRAAPAHKMIRNLPRAMPGDAERGARRAARPPCSALRAARGPPANGDLVMPRRTDLRKILLIGSGPIVIG